jgi:amino acid transporter
MTYNTTKRPRNVGALEAAAILYGDWGTSKAYVIGLAFAIAGYSSFWIIAPIAILAILVAVNYITICRLYPNGGGVYASVRQRSQVISLLGAFFLFADYLVTASISALSAFSYIGVRNPLVWASLSIAGIGALNFLGPKHTGRLAFIISLPVVLVVIALAFFTVPHLDTAIHNIRPLQGDWWRNWNSFVGVILALSGIESIANITGVMKLDPGSTRREPKVTKTAKPAILWVTIEVCLFTTLFALAMQALPGLEIVNGDVNAPGHPGVRDEMLRYMGETFASAAVGPIFGNIFGILIGIVFCVLLLSAVNTAIVGLITLLFLMSRDKELPTSFQKLNSFGVPILPAIVSTLIPIAILLAVTDIARLADLYAIGCIGAIATNLGSASTDFKLDLKRGARLFMFCTFLILLAIEISLVIDKPHARVFVLTIIVVGLILRSLVKEHREKIKKEALKRPPMISSASGNQLEIGGGEEKEGLACAVVEVGLTLRYALEESKKRQKPLYLLFIRDQKVLSEEDRVRSWENDERAAAIFEYAKTHGDTNFLHFCYNVSDAPAYTITEMVKQLNVGKLIMGLPRHSRFIDVIRGSIIRDVSKLLPPDVRMIIVS